MNFLDFGNHISEKAFKDYKNNYNEIINLWIEEYGLNSFDFGYNFLKSVLYCVLFYFVTIVLWIAIFFIKRLILYKTLTKLDNLLHYL